MNKPSPAADDYSARLDDALARSQREEREELNRELVRQQQADERIVEVLAARR